MATPAEESASAPHSQVVANAFVSQYYHMLSHSPEDVFKFYHETSVISRPESDGSLSTVSILNNINDVILSMDYKNCVVEILTADAQESFQKGVIVLVTGLISGKDNIRKKFTQLFFLAPQENSGYFVLNDVLRYMDEEEVVPVKVSDSEDIIPILASVPESAPVSSQGMLDHASNQGDLDHVDHVSNQGVLDHVVLDDKEVNHPLSNGIISSVESEKLVTDSVGTTEYDDNSEAAVAPKKSYASVANELNFKKQPFQQRVLPAKPMEQPRPPPPRVASPRSTSNNGLEKQNNNAAKGHAIFVANLPMDATVEQLVETFKKFGPIKPNGVQVRSYKQELNCFGFVEFESAESKQHAIQVSSVIIGNRKAHIEEKKANNDGGKHNPRKGGFRSDNFRGRSRGYGRTESENQGQPRSTAGRNSEANQKVLENEG